MPKLSDKLKAAAAESKGSPPKRKPAAPKKGAKKPDPDGGREVIYPVPTAEFATGKDGLTAERCKTLLGWCEDPDQAAKASMGEPLFTYDSYERVGGIDPGPKGRKTKVWLLNNVRNRPFYPANAAGLMQEQLNKRWAGPNGAAVDKDGKEVTLNPEPVIISPTAEVLNGQHQMAGCVLAQNELIGPDRHQWEDKWPDGLIRIDKLIVFGISNSDLVVNTMDTCKPRSLADVIFRSPFFQDLGPGERKRASQMLDSAVKLLWFRLGIKNDPWTPVRTHSEAIDFVHRHQRLLEAVRHLQKVNTDSEGGVAKYIGPGYAAGLMYLMGGSGTDPNDYHVMGADMGEAQIEFGNWDRAAGFWRDFPKGSSLHLCREHIAMLFNEDTGSGGRLAEKLAVVCYAWKALSSGKKLTDDALELDYDEDETTGVKILKIPTVGGIDLGNPGKPERSGVDQNPVEDQDDQSPGPDDSGEEAGGGERSGVPAGPTPLQGSSPKPSLFDAADMAVLAQRRAMQEARSAQPKPANGSAPAATPAPSGNGEPAPKKPKKKPTKPPLRGGC